MNECIEVGGGEIGRASSTPRTVVPAPHGWVARWGDKRKGQKKEEPKYSPGLGPNELVLERTRKQERGWSVLLECLFLPRVLGPWGQAGLCA
jgi:hypothetical protein